MRIIGGTLKARRFSVPKNFPSRPTTDFAKEGLFNVLEHTMDLSDLNVLDLCSGTGNIAFEFISRGSESITVVDQNFNCIRFIRKSAENLGISKKINSVKAEILSYLRQSEQQFDIIFADPPYDVPFHKEIAEIIFERDLLKEEGQLIIEHGKRTDLSSLTHFRITRTYGNANFSFFSKVSQ